MTATFDPSSKEYVADPYPRYKRFRVPSSPTYAVRGLFQERSMLYPDITFMRTYPSSACVVGELTRASRVLGFIAEIA
jgi:hypothetical protein